MECPKCREGKLKVINQNDTNPEYIEIEFECNLCETEFFSRIERDDLIECD